MDIRCTSSSWQVPHNQVFPPSPSFLKRAQQAVSRLQVLNPNVTVTADTDRVEDKPDDYFSQFDVICATCCTTSTLVSASMNT